MMRILIIIFSFLSLALAHASNEKRFSEFHGHYFQVNESSIKISENIQLSGEQTQLEEIISIRENTTSQTLLVQHRKEDRSEEVLFFDLKELGLIQPHKVISESSIQNSIDLDWDSSNESLFILQHSPSSIVILDGKKNRLSRGQNSQMKIIQRYNLDFPYQSMAIMKQGILALLSPQAHVHFYSVSKMQKLQVIELDIPKENIDTVTLQWRSDLGELHIIQDQKIIDRLGL